MDRYESLLKKMEREETKQQLLVSQRKNLQEEIEQTRKDIQVLGKVEELFKYLLDKYVNKYAESFSEIVTEGLQTIFHDQDIRFEVVVDQKHGKVWADFETIHEGIRGQSLESFGGGVSSVQSLLLRLLVLMKKNLAKYLILDESLAALSEEYVENAGIFLKKMCKELGVNVLLITHNKAFLDYADNAYEAKLNQKGVIFLDKKV